jgi:RNA polymerase sigma-54 factor
MSQRPRITLSQTQRLQLNMGLQASIRLLRSDAAGLTRYLEDQAAENPALKLDPPPVPVEWLPRWSRVFAAPASAAEQAGAGPSLMAHVMAAIDRRMKTAADRRIALALAEALEPSGWLGQPLARIATGLGVKLREVEAVLRRLQEIEPVGLFARDLAECLRLQAQEEGSHDAVMAVMLAHLDLLAVGDLGRLARLAQVAEGDIARRFRLIRAMNPKPGTEFDSLAVAHPREPDLVARAEGAGWEVSLNRSSLPALRVEAGEGASAAKGVLRMVEARNSTLLRVGRAVLQRQNRALTAGPGALVPMTMAEVAKDVGLHESTVSRVVAGTSVDTPHGCWWLRLMFSGGTGEVSGAGLRDRLAGLVAAEDRSAPLSDQALAAALGGSVARRTVAKYRALLRIPPAHRRRVR